MRLFYIIFICYFSGVIGQTVVEKENRFDQLQDDLALLQVKVDSLNTSLNTILNEIDQGKSAAQKDLKKIAGLMADGLTLSKAIETNQEQIYQKSSELSKIKRDLSEFYTEEIAKNKDRLAKANSEQEKENIEQQIFLLAGKRLIVSPVISGLKFNPEKIKQINLSQVDNEEEKTILKNYIENAIANIDSNISVLDLKESELEESQKLQEKADLFVDDVANSRIVGVYEEKNYASSAETGEKLDNDPGFYDRNNTEIAANQNSDYTILRRQMQELGFSFDDAFDRNPGLVGIPMTEEEYLQFIKKGKDFLKQYRNQLVKKLSNEIK